MQREKTTKLKAFLLLLALTISTFSNYIIVNATDSNTNNTTYLERQNFTERQKQKPLTMKGFFLFYFNSIGEGIPESYKYIDLKFYDVTPNTPIYSALQKGVYLDLIKNVPIDLRLNRIATQGFFAKIVQKNFNLSVLFEDNTVLTLQYFLSAMAEIQDFSYGAENNITDTQTTYYIEQVSNFPVLNDVYYKLKNQHYDSEKFSNEELIRGAIKGMADSTGDKYTTYFPPVDAKSFNEELSGEFEGIGANVEMAKPGIMKIISPLPGSPAERFGLRAGDQILKIDGFEVTEKITLQEAVNKIKGKAGTQVKLGIIRDGVNMEISITREKIVVKFVDYSLLNNGDNYIKISIFGAGVSNSFFGAIGEVMKNNSKTIIDLRNNPGGSLNEVSAMLDYFVPQGEATVNIKYKNYSTDMNSNGKTPNMIGRNVIILINKGSASASEIMAGTIKDYLGANVKIIGETSYGKGSVQSLDDYSDGSSFKYTIAKWFTGKTKTGIDGTGIAPDIEVKFDEEKFKNGIDNQLDYAKNYRF